MRTQAGVLFQVGDPIQVVSLQLAPPQAGEVLVKVAAAGVCHSDWNVVSGATGHPLPVVLGHEGAGIVEAVGPGVTDLRVGDHVALNWAPSCGRCFYCQHDSPSLCAAYLDPIWAGTMLDGSTRFALDGGAGAAGQPVYQFSALGCFSQYTVVPAVCCVPLDPAVPLPVAALIGCAVTTGVGAVLNTAQVRPGASVVVFGAGGVGLSIVLGAKLAGAARIVVVDRAAAKRDLALSFGATDFLPAPAPGEAPDRLLADLRALTHGRGADYAFEAVGLPAVQELSLAAARPGGTVILAGLSPMGSSTNLPGALITRQEKTVKGSYYGSGNPARDFPFLADLYQQGRLDLDRLITRTWRLDEINTAYAAMAAGEVARGVIVF